MGTRTLCLFLLLSGCWKTDLPEIPEARLPFTPDVGAPDGWFIERFDMTTLTCPDGSPSRFYLVYPETADTRDHEDAPDMPLALMFHSGAFDYVFAPTVVDPLSGATYQEDIQGFKRLTVEWAIRRVFTTLGMYPNYDSVEQHAGSLPAAMAEAGVAMMLPANCWGDTWHNRSGTVDNDYNLDLFFRNGRTAAEFAYLHATSEFPPGNPLVLPINVDSSQIYLIGLGEGGRAVSELLSIRAVDDNDNEYFPYPAAGVLVDSTTDDLRPFYDLDSTTFLAVREGLDRIFLEGRVDVMRGSFSWAPRSTLPDRTAYVYSSADTLIPGNAHDAVLSRFATPGFEEVWTYESVRPAHVITNADVTLAQQAAIYLTEGKAALDPAYVQDAE